MGFFLSAWQRPERNLGTRMDIEIGRGKTARAYGLDEIAIVPSRRTATPKT